MEKVYEQAIHENKKSQQHIIICIKNIENSNKETIEFIKKLQSLPVKHYPITNILLISTIQKKDVFEHFFASSYSIISI